MVETVQSDERDARGAGCAALIVALSLLLLLCCCGVVTEALRSVGVPVGPGASEAASQVDAAIFGWIDKLFWGVAGAATTESARAGHRVVKKRREKKKAALTP